MLKKLIKYGNSHALVLDRAILELLNMSEGMVVKLHTDGKSLIITPQAASEAMQVSLNHEEQIYLHFKNSLDEIETDPVKKEASEQWAPGTANFAKLEEKYKEIFKKYNLELEKLKDPEFLKQAQRIEQKYNGVRTAPGCVQELLALRTRYVPALEKMDNEMMEARKELGMPHYL